MQATPSTLSEASTEASVKSFSDFSTSEFQNARLKWEVKRPLNLQHTAATALIPVSTQLVMPGDQIEVRQKMPYLRDDLPSVEIVRATELPHTLESKFNSTKTHKVAIILSGGPAPGGHNVVAGLYDAIKEVNSDSQVLGFRKGIDGLFTGDCIELTDDIVDRYRNTGGFDMLFSGRGCVKPEQEPAALEIIRRMGLTGLVIVGGDGSNSNTAAIANLVGSDPKVDCCVIGVPKTIDGDLKNSSIECSFGFDTAAKVYSEQIGNIMTDVSARKDCWHFIRVMGRLASHLVLECALQTHPNIVFVSEEVQRRGISLKEIVDQIVDCIISRMSLGKKYGVVLVPEGLIGFIPELELLINELSSLLKGKSPNEPFVLDETLLTPESRQIWTMIPSAIKRQMLDEREASGYIQVAKIATEEFLSMMVEGELVQRGAIKRAGEWKHTHHYFGYEGRCAIPSGFDAAYCYSLGLVAGQLIHHRMNGYMATVRDLAKPIEQWRPCGVRFYDLLQMVNLPSGRRIAALFRQEVELNDPCFLALESVRESWKLEDYYRVPGPIQYGGACGELSNFVVNPPAPVSILQSSYSPLAEERLAYDPKTPATLTAEECGIVQSTEHCWTLTRASPSAGASSKIGICFLGQASAGANNIMYGMIKKEGVTLVGFVRGFEGMLNNDAIELDEELLAPYKNQGGIGLLGAGETRLLDDNDRMKVLEVCNLHELNGLVLCGEDLTEVTRLSSFFKFHSSACSVLGIYQSAHHEGPTDAIVGLSTNLSVQAYLVGNAAADAASMPKYYHFVRIDSHFKSSFEAMECAVLTHPNMVLISEQYSDLSSVITAVADVIQYRANELKKDYGVVLVPQSLWASIPELNELLNAEDPRATSLYSHLPHNLTKALVFQGCETRLKLVALERIIATLVKKELNARASQFKGLFQFVSHNLSFQGRGSLPNRFDCDLGFSLGAAAVIGVRGGLTDVVVDIENLANDDVSTWSVRYVAYNNLVGASEQALEYKKVCRSMQLEKQLITWAGLDMYINPGPIQFS